MHRGRLYLRACLEAFGLRESLIVASNVKLSTYSKEPLPVVGAMNVKVEGQLENTESGNGIRERNNGNVLSGLKCLK